MTTNRKQEIKATATLVGAIVGAGIFGVPYVFSQAGVMVGIGYGIVLGCLTALLHWYFALVALAVPGHHRFPGFAEKMLGPSGKRLAAVLGIFGGWLGLIAYVILGGSFLRLLFEPWLGGGEFFWSLISVAVGIVIVLGGLSLVTRSEVFLGAALVILFLGISAFGIREVTVSNLFPIHFQNFFLPYGVILFSLSGLVVIPELEDTLSGEKRKRLKRVILWGTGIPIVLTILFGVVVAGIGGADTSPDAISGLARAFGPVMKFAGAGVGFLAIITSLVVFLLNQIETFRYDFRSGKLLAWGLSLAVPLVFFFAGARDFISVIGLAGGFTGGLTGVLIVGMYLHLLRNQRALKRQWVIPIMVALFFFVGAVVEIVQSFFG